MRFLMRIRMPTAAENPVVGDPDFEKNMRALLLKVNALSATFGVTDGRRVDHIIVDVEDPKQLPGIAEPFFRSTRLCRTAPATRYTRSTATPA